MSVFSQTFPVFLPEFFFWDKFADSFWCFFRVSGYLAAWTECCSLLPIFRHYCKVHISQLHRTGTISILKMLKIAIILKLHSSKHLKCSSNTGPWTSVPQEGYQGGRHKTVTACAAQPALRGCEHLQHVGIHRTWSGSQEEDLAPNCCCYRGTPPFVSRHGVTGEEQPDWTVHGDLEENFGKNEGVGLKRSLKEAWRLAAGRRELGEMTAVSKLYLMTHFISEMVCSVWSDSTEKILNRYREKYKHDLCSPIDRAQYMQAPVCMFVSINPPRLEKILLLMYTGKNTWGAITRFKLSRS